MSPTKQHMISCLDKQDLEYVRILTEEINGRPYDENLLIYYNDKIKNQPQETSYLKIKVKRKVLIKKLIPSITLGELGHQLKITVKRKVLIKKLIPSITLGELGHQPKPKDTKNSFSFLNTVEFVGDGVKSPNKSIKDVYKMPNFRKIPKLSKNKYTLQKQINSIDEFFRNKGQSNNFDIDTKLNLYNAEIENDKKIRQREQRQNKKTREIEKARQDAIEANKRQFEKSKFKNILKEIKTKGEAKRKIANFIERHTNNALTLEQMKNLVERILKLKSPNDLEIPFEIVLQSAVIDIQRKFKFKGITHFLNFWEKVENSGEVLDYDYTNTYKLNPLTLKEPKKLIDYEVGVNDKKDFQKYANATNRIEQYFINEGNGQNHLLKQQLQSKNIFLHTILKSLKITGGGCNNDSRCTDKTITSSHYNFTVYNPVGRDNNCFFKCLNKITGQQVDIKKLRKQFDLPAKTMIDIQSAYKIIKETTDKKICIIDHETNEELDEDETYILIKNQHYYVVEKFEEKIFKDKKTKRGLLTFDFETRQTEKYYMIEASQTKSYLLKDTICSIYYNEYNVHVEKNFKKQTFITDEKKTSARKFIDWLNIEKQRNKTYNIIAHNGGNFDFYFIISCFTEQELKDCDIGMRGTTIISINYKGHQFKDSYCFMTFSLETLSNNFKVDEGKMTTLIVNGKQISSTQLCFYRPELKFNEFLDLQNTDKDYWYKYVEYCERDCIALYQIWEKFTCCVNELISTINPHLLRFCPLMGSSTIGSHSKKILNALNISNPKYPWLGKDKKKMDMFLKNMDEGDTYKIDMEKYNFLCKFKRGGISHCHKAGLHTNGITSVDIASQYPASLVHSRIPVGFSHWRNSYDEKLIGFYHLRNMVFDTPYTLKPIAIKKDSGVLNWNTDVFVDECYIDSYTILYLKKYYGLKTFEVIEALLSYEDIDSSKLFGKYVNTFYDEKKRQDALKKANNEKYNPALRETIKLYLNSLTGKLVENPAIHFSLKFDDDSIKKLNGVGVAKHFNTEKYNDWIIAGVMVYSYSKRLLFEYIRCLPEDSNSVIHIETDGIYYDTRDKEKFDNNLKNYDGDFTTIKYGDDLGNVKIEKSTKEGQDAYFLGKKFYCITDTKESTYKVKGIPKSTIDDEGNKIQLVDKSLYETIFAGEKIVKEFKTLKRNLFQQETNISAFTAKRTINPNMKYKKWE